MLHRLDRIKDSGKTIALIDGYTNDLANMIASLENLDYLLSERSEEVYRCTCNDDEENPKGVYEYDTNAFTHSNDCPSGWEYHYHVLLIGLAEYFKKEVQTNV